MTHTTVSRPDGAVVAAQVDGPPDAPALVLLQGQASSHTWWTDLRTRYRDRFRTVTMDYRGTGATRSPAGELTTTLASEDLVAVLDTLHIARAHVYGTSMGGRVAQMVAVNHPDRVLSLALACTSPGGRHATERSDEVRRALASTVESDRLAALVSLLYTPAWGSDPSRSHLLGDPTMSTADRQRHLRMSAGHDSWDRLPRIEAPTLVLHGGDDEMTPPVNGELLAQRIPGADLHLHPGGRHGFFDEFATELDPVLHRLWTGRHDVQPTRHAAGK